MGVFALIGLLALLDCLFEPSPRSGPNRNPRPKHKRPPAPPRPPSVKSDATSTKE